jgi:hypothetical protein
LPRAVRVIEESARLATVGALRPYPQRAAAYALLAREMDALLNDAKPPEQVAQTLLAEGNRLLESGQVS